VFLHELGHTLVCISIPNAYVNEIDVLSIKFINDNNDYNDADTLGFIRCLNVKTDVQRGILKLGGFLLTQLLTLFIGYPLLYTGNQFGFLFFYFDFMILYFIPEINKGFELINVSSNAIIVIHVILCIINLSIIVKVLNRFLELKDK